MKWQAYGLLEMELAVPPTVYPPREDTTLLDKALAELGSGHGRRLLEIGCGSGAISIACASRGWQVYACDINPLAVVAAKGNCSNYATRLDAEFCEGGPGDIDAWMPSEGVDVIAWNLPYLECQGGPRLGPMEETALVNQGDSAELLKSLTDYPEILNPGGVVLMLHSSNQFGRDLTTRWRKAGWATRNVESCNLGDERLTVVAFWKPFENAEIICLDTCESTNDEIFDKVDKNEGDLITTKKQISGRGHHGNIWEDSKDGFMGSWNLHKNSIDRGPWYIQMGGFISVLDAFSALNNLAVPSHSWANSCEILNQGLRVKWPNDLWYQENEVLGKLSGVIAESRSQGEKIQITMGIGINRSPTPSIKDSAGWDLFSSHSIGDLVPIIHASVASIFEEHPMLQPLAEDDLRSVAFSSMRLTFCEASPQAFGLDSTGGLVLKDRVVHQTGDVVWSWN